jgi:hypothetical protein
MRYWITIPIGIVCTNVNAGAPKIDVANQFHKKKAITVYNKTSADSKGIAIAVEITVATT